MKESQIQFIAQALGKDFDVRLAQLPDKAVEEIKQSLRKDHQLDKASRALEDGSTIIYANGMIAEPRTLNLVDYKDLGGGVFSELYVGVKNLLVCLDALPYYDSHDQMLKDLFNGAGEDYSKFLNYVIAVHAKSIVTDSMLRQKLQKFKYAVMFTLPADKRKTKEQERVKTPQEVQKSIARKYEPESLVVLRVDDTFAIWRFSAAGALTFGSVSQEVLELYIKRGVVNIALLEDVLEAYVKSKGQGARPKVFRFALKRDLLAFDGPRVLAECLEEE